MSVTDIQPERIEITIDVNEELWTIEVSETSIIKWFEMGEVNLESARNLLRSLCLGMIGSYDESLIVRATNECVSEFINFASGAEYSYESQEPAMQSILSIYEKLYQTMMEYCDRFRIKH
jgi:hypothetical protein